MMGPLGHFGIALAAKPLIPEIPLWTLLAVGLSIYSVFKKQNKPQVALE
jgi:hypothetical protein